MNSSKKVFMTKKKVEQLRKFLKISICSLLGIELALIGSVAYNFQGNKAIKPYVENNLTKIIQKQEEKMGLKHFDMPSVEYDLPKDLPQIIKISPAFVGLYRPEEDKIYLITCIMRTKEFNLENTIAEIANFGFVNDAEEVVYHELGHFYADKLSEYLGWGNWPPKVVGNDKFVGVKMVSEGIAEYFEHKSTGNEYDKPPEYLLNLEEFKSDNDFFYNGGYQLVKPIIDKHGRIGIAYLIESPPELEDIIDLVKYQKRAIEFLDLVR